MPLSLSPYAFFQFYFHHVHFTFLAFACFCISLSFLTIHWAMVFGLVRVTHDDWYYLNASPDALHPLFGALLPLHDVLLLGDDQSFRTR